MSSAIPSASGIYRIVCVPTGKLYIGSAENLQKRRREHLHALRHGKHHSITLQRAFDKYGEDAFVFEVVELVLIPFLVEREQYWLDKLKPFEKRGFNINPTAGSRLGAIVSPQVREKLRIANLGKTHSEATKRKIGESGKGRTMSPQARAKISATNMGHPVSDIAREHMRTAQLGKKQSEATIEKRRLSGFGRTVSDATRVRLSASNAAHPFHVARMKTLIVTSPDGEAFTIHGIGKFCREHNLNRSALIQVAKGKCPHHKGWKARYP